MGVILKGYTEIDRKRTRRIVWVGFNALLFPLLPSRLRNFVLRAFGASIGCSLIYRSVRIHAPWNLKIGDWSCIGPHVDIYNKDFVTIGSHTVVSQGAYLCTASHDVSSPRMALKTAPIVLGDSVWVAARAIVLPGVTIGEGGVAGCAAVVTKDIAPWTVVGGNPACEIKKRSIMS